jgi:hypothetical protein
MLNPLRRALVVLVALAAVAGTAGAQVPPVQPVPGPSPAPLPSEPLFRGDRVEQIRLFMHSKDWEALRDAFRENTYYPADMHWNGTVVRNIGIRSRGLGSRSRAKPGLRLDFDRYSTTQKFLGLKSLVLDNLTQDPGMMRERLAMALFARVGMPAPREAHTGLWVNNEFVGLYAIVESIDKSFLERTLGEDSGYLYEFNNVSRWWFDMRFDGDLESYGKIFDPKTHEQDPPGVLFGPISDMVRAANEPGDFAGAVGQYLDLQEFARYLAAETFMAEYDGMLGYDGANNFYYYRSTKSNRARFLPWDRDLAFHGTNYSVWSNLEANVLAARALSVPELEKVFLDTLEQLAVAASEPPDPPAEGVPPSGPGWFEREARRIAEQIRDGALADANKPPSNEKHEEDVAFLIEFARSRSAFVMGEVQAARSRSAAARR